MTKTNQQYKILVLLVILLIVVGCSRKAAVPAENIRFLAAVRTAVSFKSQKLIDNYRETVQVDVEQGKMSEKLAKELESVFELADQGEWQQAEKQIMKIQDRYKPDPATVSRCSHGCVH
jgi:hypothetical protein